MPKGDLYFCNKRVPINHAYYIINFNKLEYNGVFTEDDPWECVFFEPDACVLDLGLAIRVKLKGSWPDLFQVPVYLDITRNKRFIFRVNYKIEKYFIKHDTQQSHI